MARLCAGFLSLLFGLALMLSRSPFLLLPCLAAAWAWPLATCFAEPVYHGAVWRHRFTHQRAPASSRLIAPFLLYAYVAVGRRCRLVRGLVVPAGADGLRRLRRSVARPAMVFITAAFMVLLGVKRMRVVPIETLEVTDELSLLELPAPRDAPPQTPVALIVPRRCLARRSGEGRSAGPLPSCVAKELDSASLEVLPPPEDQSERQTQDERDRRSRG